jgi:ClpP class serine protease
MRALDVAMATAWAMTPEALRVLLDLADRQEVPPAVVAAAMHGNPEAVAAKQGTPLDRTETVEIRDGVAILPVEGPIFRYANLFTEVSGATSVEILARDFTAALDDPAISGILLHIDSPGGEAAGVGELADMIFAARGRKPVTAYVSSLGASAGYWLASSASRVVVSESAMLGSIGVVMAVPDPSKDRSKEIEFVSSQSPNKRADPNTQAGKAQYQAIVDQLGDVFISAIARNRGMTPEKVVRAGGEGGIKVGGQAVKAGLADALGSYEGALADLAGLPRPASARIRKAARPAASLEASARPARKGGRMDRLQRFFAWLDGQDGGITTTEEDTMAESSQDVNTRPAAAPPAPPPAQHHPAPAADDGELRRVRAELEASKAQIIQLRNERIAAEAEAFADAAIRDEKARPAERAAIVAAYTRAALDDSVMADGADRVGTIKALYGARPKGSLTREELDPVALQILRQRETTGSDPNAPASQERLDELLGKTSLGAAVLAERNGRGN